TPNAVAKLTGRLCRKRVLARHPLFPPSLYFTLGRQSAAARGLPLRCTFPLGPQALAMEYATLAYTALGERPHRRLSLDELTSLLPGASRTLLDAPYALDEHSAASV